MAVNEAVTQIRGQKSISEDWKADIEADFRSRRGKKHSQRVDMQRASQRILRSFSWLLPQDDKAPRTINRQFTELLSY